ncbi:MAG: hypothetical protein B7Y02_17635, partial [Rhodobacterales bacterium 17-64-5]
MSGKQSPNGAVGKMGSLQSLQIASAETGTIRAQFAALCWQPHGAEIDVLLITSRDTGRWIIPK